jgi:hypothetical protein
MCPDPRPPGGKRPDRVRSDRSTPPPHGASARRVECASARQAINAAAPSAHPRGPPLSRTRGSLGCPCLMCKLLLALALSGFLTLRPPNCLVVSLLRLSNQLLLNSLRLPRLPLPPLTLPVSVLVARAAPDHVHRAWPSRRGCGRCGPWPSTTPGRARRSVTSAIIEVGVATDTVEPFDHGVTASHARPPGSLRPLQCGSSPRATRTSKCCATEQSTG